MTKIPRQLAKNKITILNLKMKKKTKDDVNAENYLKYRKITSLAVLRPSRKNSSFLVTGRFSLDLGGCLARGFALFLKFYMFQI